MTHFDHSNTPIDKKDDPNALCDVCKKRKCNHSFDQVKECNQRRVVLAGEAAGTRHSRK